MSSLVSSCRNLIAVLVRENREIDRRDWIGKRGDCEGREEKRNETKNGMYVCMCIRRE
jgi:hypothetical protein